MSDDKAKVIDLIQSEKIEMVDLKFVDLFGYRHHITVPAKSVDSDLFNNGIGFDGSSVPGFKSIESGDMVLLPDPSTAFVDPFWDEPTLGLICDIADADTRIKFHRDPRYIAKKAEKYLVDSGIATESIWGPEFEYYLFDSAKVVNRPNYCCYEIQSREADWATIPENQNCTHTVTKFGGYHVAPPQDQHFNIRNETVKLLEDCNIKVHYHHHEVGGAGQTEIEVKRYPLTKMGDYTSIIKYFIKMIAVKYDMTATFMPKPLYDYPGNGMHFHQHLFRDGEPLFYDENGYGGLSKLAHQYIAGILSHSSALLALTNPSTNSYKRLIPGYEAPVNVFFSLANRSAAIRIPKYATQPMEKRIEFRPPDATGNIYLSMAAMLMAGIDGIKKEMDPGDMGFGPIDENVFAMKESERSKIKSLPSSLEEALVSLEKDSEFLLKGGVFTEDTLETWIKHKFDNDIKEINDRPHPYEMALYYNI